MKPKEKVTVAAGVTEPHEITAPFVGPLADGDIEVKVLSVTDENPDLAPKFSENWEIACEYPDGFVASHQVPKENGAEVLLTMIRNKLRGRHGVPHGKKAVEGEHGLSHVAGKLLVLAPLPASLLQLAGTTLAFKKVG
jgi:hypothetical protein